MKRKIFVLIIFLGILLPITGVLAKPVKAVALFNTADIKNTLAEPLLVSTENGGSAPGLPVVTPFWVDMVNAEIVPNDGEGVYVAVLDTGLVSAWPFFFSQANIAWDLGKGYTHDVWWDDTIGDLAFGPLRDDRGFLTSSFGSGHGTHVASTIVGWNYNNIFWVRGVAPKATIIPVLVLDYWNVSSPYGFIEIGGGTDPMVAAGINYIADLSEELDGPVIISMSLGGDTPAPIIEEAIDNAISKGVIVVASAGNDGYDGMGWPGAYPQVISCAMAGGTEQFTYNGWWAGDVPEKLNTVDSWGNNHQLFLDYMSSRPNKDLGQKSFYLDVTTPGCAIVGPYQRDFVPGSLGYYYLWGTSMAAPHVSGIAAMVLQDYPGYTQSKMEKTLKNAAHGSPLPCDGSFAIDFLYDGEPIYHYFNWYGTDYGSGFLQANEALKSAK